MVALAGGFDSFHQRRMGYIKRAAQPGTSLYVLVSNDSNIIRKKQKCFIPL